MKVKEKMWDGRGRPRKFQPGEAVAALVDEFAAVGEEEDAFVALDAAMDHGGGDGGFARAGGRD